LTPALKALLLSRQTYVNIHTGNNPAGEIRGQIVPAVFKVALSGEAERPDPVSTRASGFGVVTLVGKAMRFQIAYSGLSGPATAAHFHGPATDSGATGILIDLEPFNGGGFGTSGILAGSTNLTDELLAHLADGLLYVNVHTEAHPAGEIRSQVLPHLGTTPLSAALLGAAVKPNPVTTDGTAFASLSINGDDLGVHLFYQNLSSTLTEAHIQGPASSTNVADDLIDLTPLHQGRPGTNGVLSGHVTLTTEQREQILAGQTYINLHTQQNSEGEVRGQIYPIILRATLNGQSERPDPITTAGTGEGTFSLLGRYFSYGIRYRGLTGPATAAHVHGPAPAEGTADVLFGLDPVGSFGTSGFLAGLIQLNTDQLAAIVDGLSYVNIHTATNQAGEIRGQIAP
jgi:hypothetical protein